MALIRRLGCIGDVHTEDEALEAAILFLRSQSVDRIVCVGDVVDGPGNLGRCCELLGDSDNIDTVRGNHERWILNDEMRMLDGATQSLTDEQRDFLAQLPLQRTYETPLGRALLCHGIGDDDMSRVGQDDAGYALETNDALQRLLRDREYSFVINGHSHRRMVRTIDQLTIINVGTLFRDHDPCLAIADFDQATVRFYDFVENRLSLTFAEHVFPT